MQSMELKFYTGLKRSLIKDQATKYAQMIINLKMDAM